MKQSSILEYLDKENLRYGAPVGVSMPKGHDMAEYELEEAVDVVYLTSGKYHLVKLGVRREYVRKDEFTNKVLGPREFVTEISSTTVRKLTDIERAEGGAFMPLRFDGLDQFNDAQTGRIFNAILRCFRTLGLKLPPSYVDGMAAVSNQSRAYWRAAMDNQLRWEKEGRDEQGMSRRHTETETETKMEEETMTDTNTLDAQTILALQSQHGVKTCKVTYGSDTTRYTYKSKLPLKVGDSVLVQQRKSFTIAKVRAIDDVIDMSFDGNLRWVLGVVNDMLDYGERLDASEEMIGRNIIAGRALEGAKKTMEAMGVPENQMHSMGAVPDFIEASTEDNIKALNDATGAGTVA